MYFLRPHSLTDNEVELPFPDAGTFSMRFVQAVDKHGTHDLPEMFYEGVMFGVSSGNSHNVEVQYSVCFSTLIHL